LKKYSSIATIYFGGKYMADMILDIQTLPEALFSKISTKRVKIHEENGSIILTPVSEMKQSFDVLFGMFSDGKISTEEYMKEKQIEKELEN
jgi:virulence-associated protein VagC